MDEEDLVANIDSLDDVETALDEEAPKRVPTSDQLLKGKKPVVKWVQVALDNGDVVDIKFRAIGTAAYDRLMSKYPPTAQQRKDGLVYDLNRFAPALFHYCMVEPEMSLAEAQELWNSDSWNRGELSSLFMAAVEVNNKGMDIPFTRNG